MWRDSGVDTVMCGWIVRCGGEDKVMCGGVDTVMCGGIVRC